MLGKALRVRAQCTGATTASVLVLMASHSDSAERQVEFVYHRTRGVEELLETHQCTHLAEERSGVVRHIDAAGLKSNSSHEIESAGTDRISAAQLNSERFLDGPDTVLAAQQIC